MHIGWSRIWKVLLGCACAVGSIVLLACGLVGWGIAALEAAALLLALQYAPRAARLWKTWWFVELVLVLAATVGYAGFAAVRTAAKPAYPTVAASTSTSSTNHHVFHSRAARGAYCSASSSAAASSAAMPQPTSPQASRTMLPTAQAQPSSTFQMRLHPICIPISPSK